MIKISDLPIICPKDNRMCIPKGAPDFDAWIDSQGYWTFNSQHKIVSKTFPSQQCCYIFASTYNSGKLGSETSREEQSNGIIMKKGLASCLLSFFFLIRNEWTEAQIGKTIMVSYEIWDSNSS